MKKTSHSPILFLALLLLCLSLTLTLSMARESIRTGSASKDDTEESSAPVVEETGTNMIWQSVLHRF
jgi:hypothetical protein